MSREIVFFARFSKKYPIWPCGQKVLLGALPSELLLRKFLQIIERIFFAPENDVRADGDKSVLVDIVGLHHEHHVLPLLVRHREFEHRSHGNPFGPEQVQQKNIAIPDHPQIPAHDCLAGGGGLILIAHG